MLSGHQRITWRRNIAENFNRLSRVHERYRRQTTDRETTDGRTTTYSEHEHEFTFAKNSVLDPGTRDANNLFIKKNLFKNTIIINTLYFQDPVFSSLRTKKYDVFQRLFGLQ